MINENNVGKSVFGKKKKIKEVEPKKESANEFVDSMVSQAGELATISEEKKSTDIKNDHVDSMLSGANEFKNDHAIKNKNKVPKTQTNWAIDSDVVDAIYRLKPELRMSYGNIVSKILRDYVSKEYPQLLRK